MLQSGKMLININMSLNLGSVVRHGNKKVGILQLYNTHCKRRVMGQQFDI